MYSSRPILIALSMLTLLLSCKSTPKIKSYQYIETKKEQSLFGGFDEKKADPKIIKAENDSVAYCEAYQMFCIEQKVNRDMKKEYGKYNLPTSEPISFKLLSPDGSDITYSVSFMDYEKVKKEIEDRIFSMSSSIEGAGERIEQDRLNNFRNTARVDSTTISRLMVDKTAVKWGLKLPTSDMIKELYLYLKPHTMPNPFAENFNILLEYKDRCYHEDNNLYYALHTDPNPRLQFVRERTICVRKAEKGDLQSILNLAAYYYWCEGEYGDYPKAIKWIKKGVKQNHPTALCLLGCAYWSGNGVDQNIGKAIDLLTQSAQMGYATAYYHLSKCYEYTQPPVCDYIKAYAYLLISKWAVTDYPEYNDVDERMSYVYRSKLNKNESLYDEAIELARRIYPTLVFVDNEPALYMGEACQKELTENWIRWKWNSISDGVSDLPINQL